MPQRSLRLTASTAQVEQALEALREELEIPSHAPAEVEEEARRAAEDLSAVIAAAAAGDLAAADQVPSGVPRPRLVDEREIPLVTIDPPLSTDLDQAVHLSERPEGGWLIEYAIASLAEVVAPGGPLDLDVRSRAVTAYGPGGSFPLHPEVISAGVCSLLPQEDRIALLWRITLDGQGRIEDVDLTRALVRSRAKLSYRQVQDALDGGASLPPEAPADLPTLLAQVGAARQEQERLRGGASLNLPEQEVVEDGDGYRLDLRDNLPVEDFNAQISLTTGIAAAQLMSRAGVGVLRTLPPADPEDVAALRRTAQAEGIAWAQEESYGEVLARMDASIPLHAAFLDEATMLFRGSGYRVLEGQLPEEDQGPAAATTDLHGQDEDLARWRHAAVAARYAHVTAPLRRLVDRYGLEVCLALSTGTERAAWIDEGLAEVSAEMTAGTRVANQYAREAVDAVEALVLSGREGQLFEAILVEVREPKDSRPEEPMTGTAQVLDPAVRARVRGEHLEAGTRIRVRVAEVDVVKRHVLLDLA